MIGEAAGLVSVAIWLYLLAFRGGFWRIRLDRAEAAKGRISARSVAAVVPARNEADVVGRAVRSLLAQEFDGRFHVFLVDDDSTDATVGSAQRAAEVTGAEPRLTIVRARPLPTGWTGKVWAQAEGLRAAESFAADYFLLTDADIEHGPRVLTELVGQAEAAGYDLVSLMARLSCTAWAERALIPPFVFFFFMLYPPAWVAQHKRRTAAAAGGCMLVRRETLESYLKRLEQLETAANSFKGVEKSYAIQAGREIRIIVKPEDLSDALSAQLSRDIAKKIEQEMSYPGQIKVTVVRESRYVEFAK